MFSKSKFEKYAVYSFVIGLRIKKNFERFYKKTSWKYLPFNIENIYVSVIISTNTYEVTPLKVEIKMSQDNRYIHFINYK